MNSDEDDEIEKKAIEEFKAIESNKLSENKNKKDEDEVNEEKTIKPVFKSSKKSSKPMVKNPTKTKTSIQVKKTLNNKQLLSFGDDDDE